MTAVRPAPDATMLGYFARRIAFAVLLVFAVSSASLVLARLAPGDYVTTTLGIDARQETIARTRARYGLDRPFAAQYRDWIVRAARLDFGRSLLYDAPVGALIRERAANTAILAATRARPRDLRRSAARRAQRQPARRRAGRTRSAAVSLVVLSLPPLLTSLSLVFVAARTGWLPVGGMRSADPASSGARGSGLASGRAGRRRWRCRSPRCSSGCRRRRWRRSIGQPFVLAALARGVPRGRVVWRDALKAALGPAAAVYGLVVGTLLSGSFAVEMVDRVARPRPPDARRAARARRLSRGRLRRRRLGVPRGGTLASDVALALVDPRTGHACLTADASDRIDRSLAVSLAAALGRAGAGAARARPAVRRPARRAADAAARRRRRRRLARAVHLPLDARQPPRAAVRAGPIGPRAARLADRRPSPRIVRRRARAAAALGARRLRARRLQPAAVRRAHLARPRAGFGRRRHLHRPARRRRRRLRQGRRRRPADAGLGVRARAAGHLRRARAARGAAARPRAARRVPAGSPPSSPSSARRSSPAACARSCGRRASRSTPSRRARSARGTCVCSTRHLLPAASGYVVVQLTVLVPAFIVAEATLSYVGLGFPDPIASWGAMLHDASSVRALADFPWLLGPAAAIFLVVLGLNLVLQGSPNGIGAGIEDLHYNRLHESLGRLRADSDTLRRR